MLVRPSLPVPRRLVAGACAIGLLAVATSGCTGARPTLGDEVTTTSEGPTTTTTAAPAPVRVARAKAESIEVFAQPDDEESAQTLLASEATGGTGSPLVFLIDGSEDDRLRVYLPVAPVGSTGWVRRGDVDISSVDIRIEVDLGDHRLRVLRAEEVLLDEPVSIGSTDRPQVGQPYFLKELVRPPDDDGPYGSYAYGFSGSRADQEAFDRGEGLVGIHGTTEPEDLGQDVDQGSVAVSDDVIMRMVDELGLPLGTPVDVIA